MHAGPSRQSSLTQTTMSRTFSARVQSALAYSTLPTTLFILSIYIAIFAAVFLTDELSPVPADQRGLNITQAYSDLQHIAALPHPYNSHKNDQVRAYLLARLQALAAPHPHVHVIDDLSTSHTSLSPTSVLVSRPVAAYFEGTNILVKIDGDDPALRDHGGVLFSAHYDSVSTAPGATDNGAGVVALLQLVEWLASGAGGKMKRTAVFNFNNGEEDGLHGARVFMRHPWSNITDTFLNLEGASFGGRPILFRSTSTTPLTAFLPPHIAHPHANVLSSDAFARGVIRSATDYTVYTTPSPFPPSSSVFDLSRNLRPGMQGLDFAFYKGRSKYHTRYDAIPYVEGGPRALWAMMETARGAGEALLQRDTSSKGPNEARAAVYFDLFGKGLVIFSLSTLRTFNIVILVIGPVLLLFLLLCRHVIAPARRSFSRTRRHSANGSTADSDPPVTIAILWRRLLKVVGAVWRWVEFWVALGVTVGLQAAFIGILTGVDKFIIYAHPDLVLLASFSLTYLTLIVVLSPLSSSSSTKATTSASESDPSNPDTTTCDYAPSTQRLHHIYGLTYILLLLGTIANLGGAYFLTAWHTAVMLGCVCVGGVQVWRGMSTGRNTRRNGRADGGEEDHAEPTEETPLIADHQQAPHVWVPPASSRQRSRSQSTSTSSSGSHSPHRHSSPPPGERDLKADNGEAGFAGGWWIVQVLLSVGVPVMLVSHVVLILVGAMPQTLADGSSSTIVYAAFSFLSLLLLIPVVPFAGKMHGSVAYLAFGVFVVSMVGMLSGLGGGGWEIAGGMGRERGPFSVEAPLKVFFGQSVEVLDLGLTSAQSGDVGLRKEGVRAVTMLSGVGGYVEDIVRRRLPSASGREVQCLDDEDKLGLVRCTWEGGEGVVPSPGSVVGSTLGSDVKWLSASVTRSKERGKARIEVGGRNTRACRVYFDNRRVRRVYVYGEGEDVESGSGRSQGSLQEEEGGIEEVRLFSRTWERRFVIDVEWDELGRSDSELRGRVACEWAEYQSGSVDVGAGGNTTEYRGARIPAFEEVLGFLPKWAAVSKLSDGLVEAWARFEI